MAFRTATSRRAGAGILGTLAVLLAAALATGGTPASGTRGISENRQILARPGNRRSPCSTTASGGTVPAGAARARVTITTTTPPTGMAPTRRRPDINATAADISLTLNQRARRRHR